MKPEIILSSVVALSTVLYTIINLLMWVESRATRRQKLLPYIIAYVKFTEDHNALCLYIENVGEGAARDVRLTAITDYYRYGKAGHPLSECNQFQNGINILPSKEKVNLILNWASSSDLNKQSIEIKVEYRDINSKNLESKSYNLLFNQIGNHYLTPPETYIGQIAHYLKEISSTIKKAYGTPSKQ